MKYHFGIMLSRSCNNFLNFVFQLMFVIWLSAYSCLGAALYASVSPHYSQPEGAVLATAGLFTKHYGLADININEFWGILGFRFIVASFMIFAIGSLTAYVSMDFSLDSSTDL